VAAGVCASEEAQGSKGVRAWLLYLCLLRENESIVLVGLSFI